MMMLQMNDLRVGNWLDWMIMKEEGKVYKKLFRLENGGQIDRLLDQLEPIPLTEQWLSRFSFTKESPGIYRKGILGERCSLKATIPLEGDYAWVLGSHLKEVDQETELLPIQHVHQLQNLYFALTRQELVWMPGLPIIQPEFLILN